MKNKAEILYEKNHRNLGVRDFDRNTLQYYKDFFLKKYKVDLEENPKSVYRLLVGIEKQRKVLSGNNVGPISIECLFEDLDLFHNMNRDDYIKMNGVVIETFQNFVSDAIEEMKKLKIDLSKLHSVERIGGGTRIPVIEESIRERFGVENVSKTLDASESIARGCVIQSAMQSPRYSVQPYVIKERSHYPITIKLGYGNETFQEKMFFKEGTDYNKTLSISIKRKEKLNYQLIEKGEEDLLIEDSQVKEMKTDEKDFEGKLHINLNKNGLVLTQKVEMIEKKEVIEKVPKKSKDKSSKDKGDVKNKDKDNNKDTNNNNNNKDNNNDNKMQIEEEFEMKKKTKQIITPLKYTQNYKIGLNQQKLQEYIKFE